MTVALAQALIKLASVTPEDAGCQRLIAERLEKIGGKATHLRFEDVDNLWLTHGDGDPVLVFLGHTDVVPTGPIENWHSDPFQPEIRDGCLYGRGAADMKGSVAAMVTAFERFLAENPAHPGTLALLLTSDEEGIAVNGTKKVVAYLEEQGIRIKWCLVGEPTCDQVFGDTIKNGRRGSLTGHLTVFGTQGHVAYPDKADNPIHAVAPVLARLVAAVWDNGNEHYPPTSFQVSNIHAGTGADNVIPGTCAVQLNFRYSTEVTEDELIDRVRSTLDECKLRYELKWLPSSKPFLTASGQLLTAASNAVTAVTGRTPALSTSGGTSDGRFIAPAGAEVAELGPLNKTIHRIDECVSIEDLENLSLIYEKIIAALLSE